MIRTRSYGLPEVVTGPCYFSRLPNELLVEILEMAAFVNDNEELEHPRRVFKLTQINQRTRNIALGLPPLWRSIGQRFLRTYQGQCNEGLTILNMCAILSGNTLNKVVFPDYPVRCVLRAQEMLETLQYSFKSIEELSMPRFYPMTGRDADLGCDCDFCKRGVSRKYQDRIEDKALELVLSFFLDDFSSLKTLSLSFCNITRWHNKQLQQWLANAAKVPQPSTLKLHITGDAVLPIALPTVCQKFMTKVTNLSLTGSQQGPNKSNFFTRLAASASATVRNLELNVDAKEFDTAVFPTKDYPYLERFVAQVREMPLLITRTTPANRRATMARLRKVDAPAAVLEAIDAPNVREAVIRIHAPVNGASIPEVLGRWNSLRKLRLDTFINETAIKKRSPRDPRKNRDDIVKVVEDVVTALSKQRAGKQGYLCPLLDEVVLTHRHWNNCEGDFDHVNGDMRAFKIRWPLAKDQTFPRAAASWPHAGPRFRVVNQWPRDYIHGVDGLVAARTGRSMAVLEDREKVEEEAASRKRVGEEEESRPMMARKSAKLQKTTYW